MYLYILVIPIGATAKPSVQKIAIGCFMTSIKSVSNMAKNIIL